MMLPVLPRSFGRLSAFSLCQSVWIVAGSGLDAFYHIMRYYKGAIHRSRFRPYCVRAGLLF